MTRLQKFDRKLLKAALIYARCRMASYRPAKWVLQILKAKW